MDTSIPFNISGRTLGRNTIWIVAVKQTNQPVIKLPLERLGTSHLTF